MIKPGEIQQKAREAGIRDQQIEKDYVLSWILKGIAQHVQLSKYLVFKGGTVLKKVYFENYRYSEDLDFTLINNETPNELLLSWFKETFAYVKEESNIPLEIIEISGNAKDGLNFYISYIGPLGGQGNNKSVKIDISRNEKMEFKPKINAVITSYTDIEKHDLLCYTLEEILIEKMRSVMQRMQARDFYDIWYLLEHYGMEIGFHMSEFNKKCESKNLNSKDFLKKLKERVPQYRGRWQSSMKDQINDLPDFDKVEREINRHLKNI